MECRLFIKHTFVCINFRMCMWKSIFCLIALNIGLPVILKAQKVTYSEVDRNDVKSTNFDIIGKISNNYLIYKNLRNDHYIALLDGNMKPLNKVKLDFLPDKVISTNVLNYKNFFYLLYQYQRRNIVYCMAAKIDGNGKIIGKPKQLDTTAINYFTTNSLYTIIGSDDKQRIMVFKVNNRNSDNYILTTSLFDVDFTFRHKTRLNIPMQRGDFLTEFSLDNDGTVVFVKASGTSQNDNINKLTLMKKDAESDILSYYDIEIPKIFLDDIRIKVDNINKKYLVTSLFSKMKRGNIDGLYCMLWDKQNARQISASNSVFTDQVRNDAKSEGNLKAAFNDFFLNNILVRKDGGFAIAAESVYTSTRGVYNNRWDYFNYPYSSLSDYYYWNSPFYSNSYYYPWSRWGGSGNSVNRYFADNIAIMNFDSTAQLQWVNIIHKSQYDDYTDNFIGYGTLNSGYAIHFLFNQLERRTLLLTDQSITPDGQINRSPTLHNLNKDYQFMPRYAKQVSSREIIVPCQYRNFICFAKVEF